MADESIPTALPNGKSNPGQHGTTKQKIDGILCEALAPIEALARILTDIGSPDLDTLDARAQDIGEIFSALQSHAYNHALTQLSELANG